jgi:hypothetical protein
MNIETLTLNEMVELRDKLNDSINNYSDGFIYELHIRSYGRNWRETVSNAVAVQERCWEYNGDEGIIDIYTTNRDLRVHNYGETYYFPTLDDGKRWRDKRYLERQIPQLEKELDDWDNRESVPFRERPHFAPIYSRADLAEYREQLAAMSDVIEPIRLINTYEDGE